MKKETTLIPAWLILIAVLRTFRDNVLFLKHNLNAQAVGSLRVEFSSLKGEIEGLIKNMNEAIQTSNKFIADIKQ